MPTLYKRRSNGRYYFDAQVNGEQVRVSLRTKDYPGRDKYLTRKKHGSTAQ